GIGGVYSLSEDKPLKVAGFKLRDASLEGAQKYSDWKFTYSPVPPPATAQARGTQSAGSAATQSGAAQPAASAAAQSGAAPIAGLPPFAFTPQTDRAVISPATPTPVTKVVPGLQIQARIASDPKGEARFLLRLPNDWNGRLVVAGASGTRSEFNGDFAWSDYV